MASFTELVKAGMYGVLARIAARETINPSVAATGSTQADAAQLKEGLTVVTAADGTKGVKLPPAEAGMRVIVKNNAAAILKIWPATGDVVNALAANAAFSTAASVVPVELIAINDTTWYTIPLVPS